MNTMIIGIAGGTGSGKTTLTRRLKDTFGDDVSLIYHDNYYRSHHSLTYEERTHLNYDHPDAFETELMVDHLSRLLAGETIQSPVYNYSIQCDLFRWFPGNVGRLVHTSHPTTT